MWDRGTSVHVTLDKTFAGRVCGLCGDFDGESDNDFRARSGEVEATPALFGHSWRTHDDCNIPSKDDPCQRNQVRMEWSESVCSIIKDVTGLFASCHPLVSSLSYCCCCYCCRCCCRCRCCFCYCCVLLWFLLSSSLLCLFY